MSPHNLKLKAEAISKIYVLTRNRCIIHINLLVLKLTKQRWKQDFGKNMFYQNLIKNRKFGLIVICNKISKGSEFLMS